MVIKESKTSKTGVLKDLHSDMIVKLKFGS